MNKSKPNDKITKLINDRMKLSCRAMELVNKRTDASCKMIRNSK